MPRTESRSGYVKLLAQRLGSAVREQQRQRRNSVDNLAAALAHLDPDATLARGFAIVRDAGGQLVTDGAELQTGQVVSLRLARGEARASVLESSPGTQPIAT
jgi:exodeoxyribonuclease VII large subunit